VGQRNGKRWRLEEGFFENAQSPEATFAAIGEKKGREKKNPEHREGREGRSKKTPNAEIGACDVWAQRQKIFGPPTAI